MHIERDGKERHFTVRYLALYVEAAHNWRLGRLAIDARPRGLKDFARTCGPT